MQMNDTPSPEAIVKAALESAAGVADRMQGAGSEAIRNAIRSLASDANVAAILEEAKKAGEDQDDLAVG